MKYFNRIAVALAVVAAVAAPTIANADDDARKAAELVKAGEILPLEKIIERARAEHPGKILETELDRELGRYVYEVELLDDKGTVWEMELDAKTGEILRSKIDKDDD